MSILMLLKLIWSIPVPSNSYLAERYFEQPGGQYSTSEFIDRFSAVLDLMFVCSSPVKQAGTQLCCRLSHRPSRQPVCLANVSSSMAVSV